MFVLVRAARSGACVVWATNRFKPLGLVARLTKWVIFLNHPASAERGATETIATAIASANENRLTTAPVAEPKRTPERPLLERILPPSCAGITGDRDDDVSL